MKCEPHPAVMQQESITAMSRMWKKRIVNTNWDYEAVMHSQHCRELWRKVTHDVLYLLLQSQLISSLCTQTHRTV